MMKIYYPPLPEREAFPHPDPPGGRVSVSVQVLRHHRISRNKRSLMQDKEAPEWDHVYPASYGNPGKGNSLPTKKEKSVIGLVSLSHKYCTSLLHQMMPEIIFQDQE